MAKKKKKPVGENTIALNRKARHDYALEQTFEAGMVLEGWEVKSLRAGRAQLADSYVIIKKGEAWLLGGHITPLLSASTHIQTDPMRSRKLLLHRLELRRLIGAIEQKGYTLVPLKLYWHRNRVKCEIALAKGKKDYDKRAAIKEREWNKAKQGLLKRHYQ
ncbi:MAG: SsrA-binding protein SmpB [Gammaproteobacteria bacterium]